MTRFRNAFAPERPEEALAECVQALLKGGGDPTARMWLAEGLRSFRDGRAASLDAALGLRPLQPRQAQARRAAALYREIAHNLDIHGREAAREIRAMHRGDYLPPGLVSQVIELRRLRPRVPCQRVILAALGVRAAKSASLIPREARNEDGDSIAHAES